MAEPDLEGAAAAVALAHDVVDTTAKLLAGLGAGALDEHQVVAYDLAHAAAAVETAGAMLDYGAKGEVEARLTCAYVADAVSELAGKVIGREDRWGVKPGVFDAALAFVGGHRAPEFLADLADEEGPRHLDADFELVQDTFRRFAEDKVRP